MAKITHMERMAQALVAKQLDIVAAWPLVYPPDENAPASKFKSDKKKLAYFNEHFATWPALWRRVAELQRAAEVELTITATDVLKDLERIATHDRRNIVEVVDVPCAVCKGAGSCGVCGGRGTVGSEVFLHPTASYGPAEVASFESAKMGKYGVEVQLADKSKARELLARHFGLFNDKLLLARQDALPVDLPPLPDDPTEAARIYAEWVKQ